MLPPERMKSRCLLSGRFQSGKLSRSALISVKESPQDPESYAPSGEDQEPVPSFWSFPEWEAFKERFDLQEVSFDQGPMGHERRKPTTIGTNLHWMAQLSEVRGPGRNAGSHGSSVEERIEASRRWASWAPGFKKALVVAIKGWLGDPRIQSITLEQWKTHLLNDHLPFRKECQTCVKAAGKGRYHRKIVSREALSLSIDLAGPFAQGTDQAAGAKLGSAKYFLVGTFTVPVTKDGKSLMKDEPPVEEEEDPEGEELEVEEAEEEEENQEAEDQAEEWLKKVEEEEDFEVRHLTLAEPIGDRHSSHLVRAVARMVTKLRYLGLPVRRLHSDRAGEMTSIALRRWCEERGIYRTYTDGDDWKSNGRVEAEIAVMKRGIKTLLEVAGLDTKFWPLAVRHFSERRWRMQLQAMNYPVDPLKAFGSKGWAKIKRWEDRGNAWRMTRKEVMIVGPDATMSSSSQGYYVMDEDERFFHSADIVQGTEPPPEDLEELTEEALEAIPELRDPGEVAAEAVVRRRIRGKRSPEEVEMRRMWLEETVEEGRDLERGEFKLLKDLEEGWEINLDMATELTRENIQIEEELQCLNRLELEEGQEKAVEATEQSEVVLQTKTIPLVEVRKNF